MIALSAWRPPCLLRDPVKRRIPRALPAGLAIVQASRALRASHVWRRRRSTLPRGDCACLQLAAYAVGRQATSGVDEVIVPREAWLFGMSRGEYVQRSIHGDLADDVSDLCDLEVYVLGQQKPEEQSDFLDRLRFLGSASGCRILGVPRSTFLEKTIHKDLSMQELTVAYLTDSQLAQLGNTSRYLADQEMKLRQLYEEKQGSLLELTGRPLSRKDFLLELGKAKKLPDGHLHKLSDLAVYAFADKRPQNAESFLQSLQLLEDSLDVQRKIFIERKLDSALVDRLGSVDDVTLTELARLSSEKQREWLKGGHLEELQDESQELRPTASVNLEEEVPEARQGDEIENEVSEKVKQANAKTVGSVNGTDKTDKETKAIEAKSVRMGKYEEDVVKILEGEKNGADFPLKLGNGFTNGVKQVKGKEAPKTKVASIHNGKAKPEEEKLRKPSEIRESKPTKKVNTSQQAKLTGQSGEQDVITATLEDLKLLQGRQCRLLAISVSGNLYRKGPVMSIMLRENDKNQAPLLLQEDLLKTKKAKRVLKQLLESDKVLKVVHGCPIVADALYYQLGIELLHVFDTAIAWQVLEEEEEPSITTVLQKFDPATAERIRAMAKQPKSDSKENVLFDLMGMDPDPSGNDDEAVRVLHLRGLLVASLVMANRLKQHERRFKQLCCEGLKRFRSWPGQHVETLQPGEEVPFSFRKNCLVCHTGGDLDQQDLATVTQEVLDQKEAEDAAAAADLKRLLSLLPTPVLEAVKAHWMKIQAQPMELVLSVGRPVEYRCRPLGEKRMKCDFIDHKCSKEELAEATERIGEKNFTVQDRAGVDGTLHRISRVRNPRGEVVTLVMRIGRSSQMLAGLLKDILAEHKSFLLLGPPGVGKTTLLRSCAAMMSSDRPTVIVDPAGEIAGGGDEPHKSVGKALKDMAYSATRVGRSQARREAMTRVVENMTPKILVVDEIGTSGESAAARTIGERGVQLVATAHGHNLSDLLANKELQDLVGGISTSTVGDDHPQVKRTGRKTLSERSCRPVFSVLVELQTPYSVAVHTNVAASVDAALKGKPIPVQVRSRDSEGLMRVKKTNLERK